MLALETAVVNRSAWEVVSVHRPVDKLSNMLLEQGFSVLISMTLGLGNSFCRGLSCAL